MTDKFKFDIGAEAVDKILEIKEQEPGDNEYALSMHCFYRLMEFRAINTHTISAF